VHERNDNPLLLDLTFKSAILDSLPANIAVIGPSGEVLAVNLSWQKFADANGMAEHALLGVGANYLSVCRSAITDPDARAALQGIRHVMSGSLPSFYHEYSCHSPTEKRWFALRAAPLLDFPNYVVVSHEDISERILAEQQRKHS